MKKNTNDPDKSRENIIAKLVYECISTHNEIILIDLITKLEKNYMDLAKLATLGEYKTHWTHEDIMNYVTYDQIP